RRATLFAGADRLRCPGKEALPRDRRRLSRVQTELEGIAAELAGSRAQDAAEARCGRRRNGLLGRLGRGISDDARTALLGPQDREHPRQAAEGAAAGSEVGAARDLAG